MITLYSLFWRQDICGITVLYIQLSVYITIVGSFISNRDLTGRTGQAALFGGVLHDVFHPERKRN